MNHRFSFFCFCMFLAIPIFVSCQYHPEPRSILKKAIEAHGGEKNISKPRLGMLKGTDKNDDAEITQEETFDLPKRWKRVTVQTFEGKERIAFNLMIEGKVWEWEEGGEVRQTKNEEGVAPYFGVLTILLELMEEKTTLLPLKEIKANGESAIGFRATRNGKEADYYFDKTTGLLAQAKFKWQWKTGKEFETKSVVGDYKEVDGVKLPYRRTYYIKGANVKNYVQLADFFVTEVKILEKIPNNVFSLPGKD